jgi:xanthine/CO dehydrogenase XdhC/CoxF family maturation factor
MTGAGPKEAPAAGFPELEDVLAQARSWSDAGKGVALATVVETWGSSPRPPGSQLVVEEDGGFLGSVSGGCVEGAVVGQALEAIADGQPRTLEFGVSNDQAWEVGLACGGTVRVYVERIAP